MFRGLRKFLRKNVAIDLGTANTLIYLEDEGILFNEPTVIAMSDSGKVLAVGETANRYIGKTPEGISAVRPMARGVISDFDAVSHFIYAILQELNDRRSLLAPDVVVCVPSNITRTEQRTVLEAVRETKVRNVWLLEEVMAAAVGAGASGPGRPPVLVLDIGGGTSEAAIISDMAFLACETLRVAGDDMNENVMKYMKRNRSLLMSNVAAERLKWAVGAVPGHEGEPIVANAAGKDILTGMPSSCEVTSDELDNAFKDILENIVDLVQEVIRQVDDEARQSISHRGAVLTGGGALLRGLDTYMSERCGIRFSLAPNPLQTVITGAGHAVQDITSWRSLFIN